MPQEMAMDAEGYSKARGLQAIAAYPEAPRLETGSRKRIPPVEHTRDAIVSIREIYSHPF